MGFSNENAERIVVVDKHKYQETGLNCNMTAIQNVATIKKKIFPTFRTYNQVVY